MKLQVATYRLLQSKFTHYFVLFFIVVSIAAVIAGSFEEMRVYKPLLFSMTYISSFVFLLEYLTRIYSAPAANPGMKSLKMRLKYIFSFYGFVDFVAMLPCVLSYFYWDSSVVHIIILPYIFITFKLIRHSRSFRIIGQALVSVKDELSTAYTACLIMMCFSAIVMYYVEREAQPEVFKNIGDGLWWSIITFATVGYGDMYPITGLGKLLGSVISMIGIAMIAIPTGIISSSFINIIQKRDKEENREKEKEDKQEQ